MQKHKLSSKEYSILIENTLRTITEKTYKRTTEISLNPYEEIILVLENRISQEKLNKFKLHYQGIIGHTLQELLDDNYDIELLIKDLKEAVTEN